VRLATSHQSSLTLDDPRNFHGRYLTTGRVSDDNPIADIIRPSDHFVREASKAIRGGPIKLAHLRPTMNKIPYHSEVL
jgi:hypothetical protein